jgi:two-component system, cell cycle response regulator
VTKKDVSDSGTLILNRSDPELQRVRKGQAACVILIHPPGPDIGRRTSIDPELAYLIGRDTTADLVLARDSVSRQHARLACDKAGEWWVQDLGSTNGSFVNEQRIEHAQLRDGDQLRFGDAIFKFLSGSNIEAAYHEEIYRMTILDGLTGVHNKRYFLDFLEREVASAARHQHPLCLVMLDIDHFKPINDERGHLAGDAVLKELAARIRPRIRREDLFARYGGEEFAAILPVTDLLGGVRFAEQLRSIVESPPFTFDNEVIPVTISLGVTCLNGEENPEITTLIKRADDNLYEAKRLGRNRVVPSMSDVSSR